MYSNESISHVTLRSFALQGMMMRYSLFVPRLYNLCLSLGFTAGKIMPSRAFCSDESQGFPTILLAKHFGAFPFNHGRVGGVVAVGRHGPHAHHGKDLLILQASHVGYDPSTGEFGSYRRLQTEGELKSTNCGKIMSTLEWYENELRLARQNILLEVVGEKRYLLIDNELMRPNREQGLVLHIEKLVEKNCAPLRAYSTSQRFCASESFVRLIGKQAWDPGQRIPIGDYLLPELFSFRRTIVPDADGHSFLEHNLIPAMPWILCSKSPALTAAKVNTQMEFDRTYRSILREPEYQGRNLLFVSGIHIDISPRRDQLFPLTKFIPWAAYHQKTTGESALYEQEQLNQMLRAQSTDNPAQTDLEVAIKMMENALEVVIEA